MGRLIDEDIVIDIINFECGKWTGLSKTIEKKIKALPPAQPTNTQDILEYLDTVLHPIISPEHWNIYSELHDMISALPSAQPEVLAHGEGELTAQPDWGKPVGDGRPLADSEVIPRLQDIKRQIGGSYAIDRAVEVLEGLQDAKPEIILCKDCKYRGVGNYCIYGTRLAWVARSNDFCSKAERRTDG